MKSATIYRQDFANRQCPAFPNAASRKYFIHQALDVLLVAASGAGIGAALLLLLVL